MKRRLEWGCPSLLMLRGSRAIRARSVSVLVADGMVWLKQFGELGVAVVASELRTEVDPAVVERLCDDDGERYRSFSSSEARDYFLHSRSAAYTAFEYIGRGDARLVRSTPNQAPLVQHRRATWLSVSHAAGVAVAAVSAIGPLGVDVEPLDRDLLESAVISRLCSKEEITSLNAMESSARRRLLLDLWVAKEAWVKRAGAGLVMDLRTIDLRISSQIGIENPQLSYLSYGRFRVCCALPWLATE